MENKQATKGQGAWYWDVLGWLELLVHPDENIKRGKEVLKDVHEKLGTDLSDLDLQYVHYNLPIGSNRKNMENNMVSILTEEIEHSPLRSYYTIAEDDLFVMVGDSQSPDIRLYRKLSEEEVVKALTDYAKHNDIRLAPMDKELQELAARVLPSLQNPTYYTEVAVVWEPGEVREIDRWNENQDYKGIFKKAQIKDDGSPINQRLTFRTPSYDKTSNTWSKKVAENDNYVVVRDDRMEAYLIYRKISEDDVRLAVAESGLDPYASSDVKEVFNRYWEEKAIRDKKESVEDSLDKVVNEEVNVGYKNNISVEDKVGSHGYEIWPKKDFPDGYQVQPISRKHFPIPGYLPLKATPTADGVQQKADKPLLAFNVGNERLAKYILSHAITEGVVDKQHFQECVDLFNQKRTLNEVSKTKTTKISDFDKAIVDNHVAKERFFINIATPDEPTDSYTMVMSKQAVNHGLISDVQLQYAETIGAVVIKTTKEQFEELPTKEIKDVLSAEYGELEDMGKVASNRLNAWVGFMKERNNSPYTTKEDNMARFALRETARLRAVHERTFEQDAKKLEGMYYYDTLHEDYVPIGKMKYDESVYPHYGFSTSQGRINADALVNDFHEGLLKTKEEVQALRSSKEHHINNQNSTTMKKEEKLQVKQEEASLATPKAQPKEKTANEKSEEQKQHRPPQMVTVNGEKVTHAHAFQSNKNPEGWFFTAKLDGQQLRPQLMKPEDVKAYQERSTTVEGLMQTYYPSKVAKKISPEEFKADNKLSDGRVIDKMFVYKEHDENRPDVGKYKLYAQVGDVKISKALSKEDLNAFFDRVTTQAKLVENTFGEQLHLASFYKKFQLPENAGVEKISIHKNSEGHYVISANMGDKGFTPERKLAWNDLYSFFTSKTATREQLAAKYLMSDIKAVHSQKKDVSRGLKI